MDKDVIEQLEDMISKLGDDPDPRAVEFRSHAQPLVDAARGRTTLTAEEAEAHSEWLRTKLGEATSVVRGALDHVGGTLQDIDHKGKLDRYRADG